MAVSPEVKEILLNIANDIEGLGHYQGDNDDGVCIVTAPSWPDSDIDPLFESRQAVANALGFNEVGLKELYYWNDNTPTEEVLAKLRSIAEEVE